MKKARQPSATDVSSILAAVDNRRSSLVSTLQELIRVPSVSPKFPGINYDEHVGQESLANAIVADLYRQTGAKVETFAIEPGRENAVARLGHRSIDKSLIFNGHVDVVPPGPTTDWEVAPPFSGEIVGSRMYGRGTADQKSGLVAQAVAALALRDAGFELAGELILQSVVGEETGDHICGTTAVLKRGYVAQAAIVSEPSAPPVPLSIVSASPGVLWFSLTVRGKKTHSSMRGATVHSTREGSGLGVNAIDKIFLIYQALRHLEDEWAKTKRHPLWENGHFSLLPGTIGGGPGEINAPFALSDHATIQYSVIYHPDDDQEAVRTEIASAVLRAAEADDWLRLNPPELNWQFNWMPYQVSTDSEISQHLAASYVQAARGTPFLQQATWTGFYAVCDATWLNEAGIPAVTFGPGDLRVAHGNNEYVELDEVWVAARTYALAAAHWCEVTDI